MIRLDRRNQVGSRCTQWRRGKLWLDVRHCWEDPRTGRPVWAAEVLRVVAFHGTPGDGFFEVHSVGRLSYHGNRESAIRAGMRNFRKAITRAADSVGGDQ